MATEQARGCGYRKVGGTYLCGSGIAVGCDRLPYEIENCPVCGSGLKFSRGFTWLQWTAYAGVHAYEEGDNLISVRSICKCGHGCPVCYPKKELQPYGLMWVGEKFYTPSEFIKESLQMGISRRIAAIPKNLKLGETWILLAHIHVIPFTNENNQPYFKPAVFHAFRPTSIEYLIWQKDATLEKLAELDKKGITAIIIPDGDPDHDPSSPTGLDDDEKEEQVNKVFFEDLRNKIKR
jgi:hypothetical protein